ncbi:Ig-like domain-containing protein, partial [Akkermansiaceae bacterium]|nr:Ig-like domain-containing protein [Akkermansiaceae bacterium]
MTNSLPALGFKKDDKKVSGKHSGMLFILTLILALASPCQLRAAEVTNNSDEGAGSLRQAVADAEAGEIITFSDSFTITLASPITIDKDIVIDGGNSVTISGGELTSIFKINSPTRHVVYDGYVYRTLLGADINGRTQYGITEQTAAPMPDGFEVAPDSEDIVQNVIAPYYWDIWRLCTENKCWATKNYGASAGVVKDNLRNWEQIENGDYRVKAGNNYYRLLIRADVSQFTPSGVVIKNITLKDGLAKGGNGASTGRTEYGGGGGGAGMGGAIYAEAGVITIDNVNFQGNKALGGNGGNQGQPRNTSYPGGGAGGNSSFGSGGGYPGFYGSSRSSAQSTPSKRTLVGANGGFGGGGGGAAKYSAVGGRGGAGGFGGGGGGSAEWGVIDVGQLTGRGTDAMIPRGGEFGGNGGMEAVNTGTYGGYKGAGSGGGGAGLGGALFIKGASVTITNSNFAGNSADGGAAGARSTSFNGSASTIREYGDGYYNRGTSGTPGQAVGGAIFLYTEGSISLGNVVFSNNQSSFLESVEDDVYTMKREKIDGTTDLGDTAFVVQKSFSEDTPDNLSATDFSQNAIAANGNLIGIIVESLPANSYLKVGSVYQRVNNFFRIQDIANITFQPASNWPSGHGSEKTSWSFSAVYEKTDGAGNNYIYPVTGNTFEATVTAVNDVPTLKNVSTSVDEDSSVILTADIFVNGYTDVDGDSLVSITVEDLPGNGSLALADVPVVPGQVITLSSLNNDELRFTPDPDFPSPNASASVTFNWSANNNNGEVAEAKKVSITVRDTADPPVIFDDTVNATGGVPIVIDVLSNDTDPLGPRSPDTHPGSYTIEIIQQPQHGSLVLEGQKLKYVPDNVEGPATILYRINNGLDSNISTVTINVAYNQYFGKALVDKIGDENDGTTQPGDLTLREALALVGENNVEGLVF